MAEARVRPAGASTSTTSRTRRRTSRPTVIAAVDKSFASDADDALLAYPGTDPALADFNFWGRTRNNITNYRQTQFVVNLMNGTDFGAVDPRMSRMLAPSPDGQYPRRRSERGRLRRA